MQGLAVDMSIPLKKLSPWQAWQEATRRSMATGVAGWVVVGGLQAAGAIPILDRWTLLPVSGAVSTFLMALTLSLAYYHRRLGLGVFGTALALLLPFSVNLLWVRLSGFSLMFPLVLLPVVGEIALWKVHRRISGPRLELKDDAEEAIIRKIMEEGALFNLPRVDRVLWLFITLGIVVLLWVHLVR